MKLKKTLNSNVFETRTEFILAEMKDPGDEGDRRILLGDKTGSVVVRLRSILFQYVWGCISTAHACIHLQFFIRTLDSVLRKFLWALGIPKRNFCHLGSVAVSVLCESEIFDRSETSHCPCVCKINMLCIIGFLKKEVKLS